MINFFPNRQKTTIPKTTLHKSRINFFSQNITKKSRSLTEQHHFLFCRRQQSGELYKEPLLATYRPDPLKTNSLNDQENNKDKLRTRRQDQGQQDHSIFFSAGGNSQENFTKNLCWRRIGLTQ
jgi:hypothetical protein